MKLDRILVPIDFSLPSKKALAEAHALVLQKASTLTLLHVHPFFPSAAPELGYLEPPDITQRVLEAAKQGLAEWVKALPASAAKHELVVVVGDPAHEILERTKNHDLVVMSTHGRTGITRFLMGSVASRVVRSAHCPVLVLR